MQPSFLAVLTNKKILLLAALLGSFEAFAQYARGDEKPIRPGHEQSADAVQKTMSLEEYTAQEVINQALEKQPSPLLENPSETSLPTLPVEKLTPSFPQSSTTGKTKTVVIEQAIFRCEKGDGFVFVDEDNKNKFSRCNLFRAEKTAQVPIEPKQIMPRKPANACSGTLFYQGNTYIFNENEPCPIPDRVLKQLLPVSTRPF